MIKKLDCKTILGDGHLSIHRTLYIHYLWVHMFIGWMTTNNISCFDHSTYVFKPFKSP